MYDKRNNLSDQVASEVRTYLGSRRFTRQSYPRNVRLSEAPSFGLPAILYDHKCSGSEAYIMLAQELMQRERERTSGVNSTTLKQARLGRGTFGAAGRLCRRAQRHRLACSG